MKLKLDSRQVSKGTEQLPKVREWAVLNQELLSKVRQ